MNSALWGRLAKPNPPASFDFLIQEQTDVKKMPLEDPTGEWKSKPIKLATITIEPQELDLKNQKQLDALAFDPWNALADHRPLGGINRARRRIYEESKKLRHQTNAARQKSMPKGK